jgi:transposase
MAQQQRIRSAFFREGKSITGIAEEYGIDRKTVRKYITKDDWSEQTAGDRPSRSTIMDPFVDTVRQWLIEDKQRRRKQRHTAKRVYTRLVQEEAYTGSYRTVVNHYRRIRAEVFQEHDPALPLTHSLGEAEADFGEADYYLHGERVAGAYLVLSFPESNAGFMQLEPGQNGECLFEGLIAIFEHLGGIPTLIRFDNASTMVAKVLKNGGRELTERFRRFQEHFGFEAIFCNPGKGNEKGNVENKVGYLRRNLLVPEPRFESLNRYNIDVLEQCRADMNRPHYREEQSIADLFHAEQAALMPLPRIPFDSASYDTLTADGYGMIALASGKHRYSTAPKYARSRVTAQITAQTVSILDESRRPVVTHRRLYGDKQGERMEWLPYLMQLSRKPTAVKYTPVYEMMPPMLQQWLSSQSRDQVSTALKLVAELSKSAGFSSACAAITDSIAAGITDTDSLVALHDRNTRYAPILPAPVTTKSKVADTKISFQPTRYDAMIPTGAAR